MEERPGRDRSWQPEDRQGPLDDLLLNRARNRHQPEGLAGLLADWSANVRHQDETAARSHRRWLRQQLEEESTFAGLLLDLAEQGLPVVVQGRGTRHHRGVFVAVAADCAMLRTPGGSHLLLALGGIASVRPEGVSGTPTGDRGVGVDLSLAEVLAALAGDRPRVVIVSLDNAEGVAGDLRAVGRDVVTIRLDAGRHALLHVPIASISEVLLEG
jgi:hypothetical protein